MRLQRRDVLVLALLVLGAISLGEAARIHAKAWLGQHLIARAWQKMQRGEEAARPWPWADTWPVARLEVPAHGVDLLVLTGSTGRTLAWGPGHLAGTAPVGAPGNAVVAGHRDTHFSFLRVLQVGTRIRTEDVAGRVQLYRVAEIFVTHDRDARVLAPTEDARLTLVTCWPFDAPIPGGPQRYVVVADEIATGRVPEPHAPHHYTGPASSASPPGSEWLPTRFRTSAQDKRESRPQEPDTTHERTNVTIERSWLMPHARRAFSPQTSVSRMPLAPGQVPA